MPRAVRHIFEDNHNWGAFRIAEKDNLRDVEIKEVNKMLSCKDESRGFFTFCTRRVLFLSVCLTILRIVFRMMLQKYHCRPLSNHDLLNRLTHSRIISSPDSINTIIIGFV